MIRGKERGRRKLDASERPLTATLGLAPKAHAATAIVNGRRPTLGAFRIPFGGHMPSNATLNEPTTKKEAFYSIYRRLWDMQNRLSLMARMVAPAPYRGMTDVPHPQLSDEDRDVIRDLIQQEAEVVGKLAGQLADMEDR